ncbi:hypothetical protein KKG20_02095, partial [bacterium]|nr:hypothetical protein [bacterium]
MKRVNLKKVVGIASVVGLLLSVGVVSIAMAEEPVQKQEETKVKGPKIELVSGKKVDKEGRETKVKKIQFFNARGQTIKELELKGSQHANLSPRKKKAGILSWYPRGVEYYEVEIYNQEGKRRGKYRVRVFDNLAVNDEGDFVVYGLDGREHLPFHSRIAFYNSSGEEIRCIEEKFGPQRIGQYSPDSSYFTFLVSSPKEKNIVYLVCFNKNGNELWRYKIVGFFAHGPFEETSEPFPPLSISEDSETIYVRGFSTKEKSE